MSESLEEMVEDLETVNNPERLNSILDEGYDAVEEGEATQEQLDEVIDTVDELYLEEVRRETRQYIDEMDITNLDQVLDKVDDLVEHVNMGRSVSVNASGVIYLADHVTRSFSREPITQSALSEIAGVSEDAISEAYQDVYHNAY